MSQFAINKNGVTNDVGAELFAAFVKGLLPTNGIINAFDNLACARVNDNLVRLSPGLYNMSGFITGVKPGTTADMAVDSGTSGYNRIDLVIAEFVRNGGGAGIDTSQIRILKGTSTTGTPVDPTLTQEDINGTGVTRQEALYRLTITGITLGAPELMADSFSVGQEFETTATNIKMDGTQSLGTLETVPRADHVHPTDTSRAPLASPAFSGIVGLTAERSVSSVLSEKVGTSNMAGTSKVISDAFITTATYVIIIPLSAPNGSVSVSSAAGSFTITSTASETFTFRWMAIK